MIIEFADPGIDWTPLWLSFGAFGVGLVLFFLAFAIPDKHFRDWMPSPGGVIGLIGFCFVITSLIAQPMTYIQYEVPEATVTALEQAGYKSVTLTGDRFTANNNGEFFSGVLVDMHPESGYAYRVLELNGGEQ